MEGRTEYIKRLEEEGYELLGSGCFSSVFARDGEDEVVKVGSTLRDAAFTWMNWALTSDNPHAPRIKSITIHNPMTEREYFSSRMEKLQPTQHYDLVRDILGTVGTRRAGRRRVKHVALSKTLHDICAVLRDFVHRDGHRNDIGASNVMQRRDGTLVITDPIC